LTTLPPSRRYPMLPKTPMFRTVLVVLVTLALVALFAVTDPLLKAALLLVAVFGGYFAWTASKR